MIKRSLAALFVALFILATSVSASNQPESSTGCVIVSMKKGNTCWCWIDGKQYKFPLIVCRVKR